MVVCQDISRCMWAVVFFQLLLFVNVFPAIYVHAFVFVLVIIVCQGISCYVLLYLFSYYYQGIDFKEKTTNWSAYYHRR